MLKQTRTGNCSNTAKDGHSLSKFVTDRSLGRLAGEQASAA